MRPNDLTDELDAAPERTKPPAVDLAALTIAANRARVDPSTSALKARLAKLETRLPMRTFRHYTSCRGNQFAASIGYFGLFSVFAMLVVAISVFGFVLRDQPALQHRVLQSIGDSLPGLDTTDLLDEQNGFDPTGLTLGVVIGGVSLLLTATGWLNAVGHGIRAIALRSLPGGNPLLGKLFQVVSMILLGVIVLASAAASLISGFAESLLDDVGIASTAAHVGTVIVSLAIGLALDTITVYCLFRFVGRLKVHNRLAWEGALLAGIGFGILKFFGSALLDKATSNPLLASGAALIGLLIWFNLLGRVILLAASWTTLRIADGLAVEQARELTERELGVGETTVGARTGRTIERKSAAAGIALGALGVLGGTFIARTWRRIATSIGRSGT